MILPVFGTDVGHDVLVEELEDEWDTVGKDQVLGDNFKLQGKKRRQFGKVRESDRLEKNSYGLKKLILIWYFLSR